jgi:hypothetical protein
MDPNILTHGLRSKAKLGMQHIHLELLSWVMQLQGKLGIKQD